QKIKGIGPALAKRIVEYREEFGNFENIEDIKNVKGIGEKIFKNMRQYLSVD
ncbi:hypothetical protein GF337_06315, partial [candidate division KSB1 bacterium]|nr:hypothetical protein [candidate division KSB1 bacterium]